MVENCLTISIFCICAAIFAVMLRQYCREHSLLISLAACAGVIGGSMIFIEPLISDVKVIFLDSGISDSYISLIFKASAMCFITQITCEICRDSGEAAIASAAELWGRAAVTYISLPVLKALLQMIKEIF